MINIPTTKIAVTLAMKIYSVRSFDSLLNILLTLKLNETTTPLTNILMSALLISLDVMLNCNNKKLRIKLNDKLNNITAPAIRKLMKNVTILLVIHTLLYFKLRIIRYLREIFH